MLLLLLAGSGGVFSLMVVMTFNLPEMRVMFYGRRNVIIVHFGMKCDFLGDSDRHVDAVCQDNPMDVLYQSRTNAIPVLYIRRFQLILLWPDVKLKTSSVPRTPLLHLFRNRS